MTRERELLESTIEYLYDLQSAWLWKKDEVAGNGEEYNDLDNLIVKIREHLSQPEQEPEAWILEDKKTGYRRQSAYKPTDLDEEACNVIPLYTTPPKREPISFEDLNIMWCGNPIDFARRIESIHGIGGGE